MIGEDKVFSCTQAEAEMIGLGEWIRHMAQPDAISKFDLFLMGRSSLVAGHIGVYTVPRPKWAVQHVLDLAFDRATNDCDVCNMRIIRDTDGIWYHDNVTGKVVIYYPRKHAAKPRNPVI